MLMIKSISSIFGRSVRSRTVTRPGSRVQETGLQRAMMDYAISARSFGMGSGLVDDDADRGFSPRWREDRFKDALPGEPRLDATPNSYNGLNFLLDSASTIDTYVDPKRGYGRLPSNEERPEPALEDVRPAENGESKDRGGAKAADTKNDPVGNKLEAFAVAGNALLEEMIAGQLLKKDTFKIN